MKRLIYVWLLCCFLIPLDDVQGQHLLYRSSFEELTFTHTDSLSLESILASLLSTDRQMNEAKFGQIKKQLDDFYHFLKTEKSGFRSEARYLKWVTEQVRNKFLHQYNVYPPFYKIFSNNIYNCLSGTALYAILLNRLGYKVEIHETAFHAYLLVKLSKKSYLIDATDPSNGFVRGKYLIAQRELMYRKNEQARYQPAFNRIISLTELAGLQYYNEATLQYNIQNYIESGKLLEKALSLYPRSERIAYLHGNSLLNQRTSLQRHKKGKKENIQTTASTGLSNK